MIDLLLSRLERVKPTGPNTWIASAPTREDKHPSLTIKLLDDGRILLHDFGGDPAEEILAAVGMDWSALFPRTAKFQDRPTRRAWLPSDVFDIARREIGVVAVIAGDMAKDRTISTVDYDRLQVAVSRLVEITEAAYANR